MTGYEHLCMNCMSDTEGKSQCPACGFSETEPQMKEALPYRTVLQERYMVGRVRRSNSEGFTYIGFDLQKLCTVQVREFFPHEICARIAGSTDLAVIAGNETAFDESLSDFMSCQNAVAKLQEQSSIVKVTDIFEENYTAYSVSPWEDSITLRYFVKRSGGFLSWNAAWKLFMPVITAASALYAAGAGHYGISPDTLFIMQDGSMKLGDFCSPAVRVSDSGLTPDLVSGCAAAEQYAPDAKLGEYTDVYSMAASLFFALTGILPKDAVKRRTDPRLMLPSSKLRSIPPHVITALANALQVEPKERTSSFERLRAELSAAPTATASLEETQSLRRIVSPYDDLTDNKNKAQKDVPNEDAKKSVPKFVWAALICAAVAACIVIGVVVNMTASKLDAGSLSASSLSSVNTPSAAQSTKSSSSKDVSAAGAAVSSAVPPSSNQVSVPNLVGKRFSSLSSTKDYQVVQTGKEFSDSVAEGCIISQKPAANSGFMVKGSAVSVTVSQGKALRTLPDVSGKSLDDAKSAVEASGFVPDRTTKQYSSSVAKGSVIGYGGGLTPGIKLNYQYSVTLVVSNGPEPKQDADQGTDSSADTGTDNTETGN